MGDMEEVNCALVELTRPSNLSKAAGDDPVRRDSVSRVLNAKIILGAVRRTSGTLYVCFTGEGGRGGSASATDPFVRDQLPSLYNELWDAALECEKVELNCIVLLDTALSFLASELSDEVETVFSAGKVVDTHAITSAKLHIVRPKVNVVSLEAELQEEMFGVPYILYDNVREHLPSYSKVAIGGTFDHFHNGHKKILTVASSICSQELIIGVTDSSMLKGKKLGEFIQPLEERKASVRRFLSTVAPASLQCSIVTIEDVWGPTASVEDIEAVVVSTEVLKGARLINEERAKRGFGPLEVIAVARSNAYTLSSTFVRRMRGDSAGPNASI